MYFVIQSKAAQISQGIEVKKTTDEQVQELEENYATEKGIETEKETLTRNIKAVEAEVQEFQKLMTQAQTIGVSMEEENEFVATFEAEKAKLVELQERQNGLMKRVQELINDPEVLKQLHIEALAENEKIEQAKLKELVDANNRAFEGQKEALSAVATWLLADKAMVRAFGLETISHDSIASSMIMPNLALDKKRVQNTVIEMVGKQFRLHAGSNAEIYKLQDKLVAELSNNADLNKYFEIDFKFRGGKSFYD
jgi:hypothetical protein